jgi:cytoskeleton protein RodZ
MNRVVAEAQQASLVTSGGVGGRLRRARRQRGLSLHDAAARTKLSIRVLQAIEGNEFDRLPGGIYRKGYLRSLAEEVGLDPNEIAAAYDEEFEPVAPPAAADWNAVLEQKCVSQLAPSPRRRMVTLVILIALAIGWFAWGGGGEQPPPAATFPGEPVPPPTPPGVGETVSED